MNSGPAPSTSSGLLDRQREATPVQPEPLQAAWLPVRWQARFCQCPAHREWRFSTTQLRQIKRLHHLRPDLSLRLEPTPDVLDLDGVVRRIVRRGDWRDLGQRTQPGAAALGVERRSLQRMLRRYGLRAS